MLHATPGTRIVVVGAGIGGLSAAAALHQAGAQVILVEAADRPGGRIRSVPVNGCVLEAGPTVLSSADHVVATLARDAGVALRQVRPTLATVVDGRVHPFRPDRPWSVFTSGAVPARSAVRLTRARLALGWQARGRRAADPSAWTDVDDGTGAQLALELGCLELLDRLWAPMLNAGCLAEAATSSAALLRAVSAHGMWHAPLTVDGGLSTLTDALGERLGVECGVRVRAVREAAGGVEVVTEARTVSADGAVVAVPGPVAASLLGRGTGAGGVPDRPASSALLVGLGVNRRLTHRELGGAYGVLIHPGDGPLASLSVASRAQHAPKRKDLVTGLFAPGAAVRLASRPDEDVVAAARAALLRLAPTLADSLCTGSDGIRVERIPDAMARWPPGRARRAAAYLADEAGPIALATDDLAWPWADASAFAGRRAARDLLRRLSASRAATP